MHKIVPCVCSMLLLGSAAFGEGQIASTWQCPKSTVEHSLEVGDVPNHAFSIAQGSCTSSKGTIEGVREKTGADTEFRESQGTSLRWHGQFTVTMENSDKVYYSYEGSGSSDPAKPATNRWAISGGTGKFQGIKGAGTCTGKRSTDGSSTWDCTGGYALGK